MMENVDLSTTTEAWANIVIENWKRNILRLRIGHTNKLVNSFAMAVHREANGNPKLIEFAFEYYGKFIDMGVKKGVSLGSLDVTPKAWYSKEFFSQIKKLGELLREKYELKAALTIVENINDNSLKK